MTDILAKIDNRLAAIVREIDALVAERDRLMSFKRTYDEYAVEPATEKAHAPAPAGGDVAPASPAPITPETANEAGGFDSRSLTEIVVKRGFESRPASDGAKGGSTGMERSDGGESPAGGSQLVHQAPATHSEAPAVEGAARADKSAGSKGSAAPTLTARVAAIHVEHPDWTGTQVHAALPGTKFNSVNATLTQVRKAARQRPVEAVDPDPAPVIAPAVERQPKAAPQPPAINIKDRIKALNAAEPEIDAYTAAERLGVSPGSIRSFSAELNLQWGVGAAIPVEGKSQPQLLTLRDKVAAMHRHHPTWTARMIAASLGASYDTVKRYLTGLREERADTGAGDEQARAVA